MQSNEELKEQRVRSTGSEGGIVSVSKKIPTYAYCPQEDITAYEVARCLEILVKCLAHYEFDTRKEIDTYNLQRHFKEV